MNVQKSCEHAEKWTYKATVPLLQPRPFVPCVCVFQKHFSIFATKTHE